MDVPQKPNPGSEGDADPWAAFGYLVAGVLFYGLVGLGLSKWLHADYWIPIGILVGAGFGMYLVFARYRVHPPTEVNTRTAEQPDPQQTDTQHTEPAETDPAAREARPEDDRGETA